MNRLVQSMILGLGCVCMAAAAAAQSPTKKYGFCIAGLRAQNKWYLSKTFETPWPVIVSIESRYIDFIKSKYGVTASLPICYMYVTMADAQRERPRIVPDETTFIAVDWTPAAAAPASASPKPQPAAPASTSSASPAPAPSQPKSTASSTTPATFVTCRSEFNTDMRRFYNPPVDGRGAGYPEWQASYQKFLAKTYQFKGSNISCGKYPTKAAAQADYDGWVSNARASPTVNGLASPVIITDWKY